MENVAKNILFTTTGPLKDSNGNPVDDCPGDSATFTVIDDVGIKLDDTRNNAVGIQVGGIHIDNGMMMHPTYNIEANDSDVDDTFILPYSSRIRANVWLGNSGGTA